jgi:hypothetical protein
MTTEQCPHSRDGLCQISTNLAGLPVPLAEDACNACQLQPNPRAVNRVTCSKAIHARTLAGLIPTEELLQCVQPPKDGVGTELERLIDRTRHFLAMIRLDWIIPTSERCGCNAAKSRLNADGPVACVHNRRLHATEIYGRWLKHWSGVRYIPLAHRLITAFIVRAAQNTRRKESTQ